MDLGKFLGSWGSSAGEGASGLFGGLGDASRFLGTDAGKGALGLAQLGLGAYGALQSADMQKKMMEQDAAYKNQLMNMQQQQFDLAKADRAREQARQEQMEGSMAEGFLAGFGKKEQPIGLASYVL